MIVCGIDPSLTRTAVCVGSSLTDITMRTFESRNLGPDVSDRMRRLIPLAAQIDSLLAETKPDLILIEGYSFGSTNRISEMAEWGGCLRWHLVDHAPVLEVAPSTLKKFVTGSGKGEKQMMIAHVASTYGKIFGTNDEVDAYGLYVMALAVAGVIPCRNQAQRDSVAKVIGTRRLFQPAEPAHT